MNAITRRAIDVLALALGIAAGLACGGCSVPVDSLTDGAACGAVVIAEYPARAECTIVWIENPSGETWLSKDGTCERKACVELALGEVAYGMTRSLDGSVYDLVRSDRAVCGEGCP